MNSPTDILQVVLFIGLPTAVIVLVVVLRFRARQRFLDVMREVVMSEKPLTPEVVAALTGLRGSPAQRDFRRGSLLVATGAGLALIGVFAAVGIQSAGMDGGATTGMILAGLGAMPVCIGAALLFLSRRSRD